MIIEIYTYFDKMIVFLTGQSLLQNIKTFLQGKLKLF